MESAEQEKYKILIVDDSPMNRELLADILSDEYEIEEAPDGEAAVSLLTRGAHRYALVLLDLVMPRMDGMEVLSYMNRYHWIENIPVIMITCKADKDSIRQAYSLGVTDIILRPYEVDIVRQRVKNTIRLYARQRKMNWMVTEQYYENERNLSLMVSVLSNIVEFRNHESGPHIVHIKLITRMLLQQVMKRCPQYTFSPQEVVMISNAAALHDIGKIAIPEEILNKPGRFTPDEYTIMKTHSQIGAEMLRRLPLRKKEPLLETAYEICRWHHERWDGKGYPDGLVGDEIPITAQVVSLADVYDALTRKRCYKDAYTPEVAVQMILNEECGQFNPMLLQCMLDIQDDLRRLVENEVPEDDEYNPWEILQEVREKDELSLTKNVLDRVIVAQGEANFLLDHIEAPCFFYRCDPPMVEFSKKAQEITGLEAVIVDPENDPDFHQHTRPEAIMRLMNKALSVPPDQKEFTMDAQYYIGGELRPYTILCHNIWKDDPLTLCGTVVLVKRKEEDK